MMYSPKHIRANLIVAEGDEELLACGARSRMVKSDYKCLVKVIAVMAALIVIAVLVVVAASVGTSLSSSKSSDEEEDIKGLTSVTMSQGELIGEYYGSNGSITFINNITDSLFMQKINNSFGEPIVSIMHSMFSNMTTMSVNNTNFMIMEKDPDRPKYDDYIVPEASMDMMKSMMMEGGEMNDNILYQLDNTTVSETRQSVLQKLAMSEEAILIIEAAQALEELGANYPSVMPFYLLALQIAKARKGINTETKNKSPIFKGTNEHVKKRGVYCSSNGAMCPDQGSCPVGEECIGMCGRNCQCWSKICSDCCVHEFCRSHDQCCIDNGFVSWSCVSVIWKYPKEKYQGKSPCPTTYTC